MGVWVRYSATVASMPRCSASACRTSESGGQEREEAERSPHLQVEPTTVDADQGAAAHLAEVRHLLVGDQVLERANDLADQPPQPGHRHADGADEVVGEPLEHVVAEHLVPLGELQGVDAVPRGVATAQQAPNGDAVGADHDRHAAAEQAEDAPDTFVAEEAVGVGHLGPRQQQLGDRDGEGSGEGECGGLLQTQQDVGQAIEPKALRVLDDVGVIEGLELGVVHDRHRQRDVQGVRPIRPIRPVRPVQPVEPVRPATDSSQPGRCRRNPASLRAALVLPHRTS